MRFVSVIGDQRRGAAAALTLGAVALSLSGCGGSGSTGATGATGAPGATGPAGPGVTWVDVTGSSAQASSNTGYVADSGSRVTITLPGSPAVNDIVEITGEGSGGWKIAQNAAQQVYVGFANALWSAVGPSAPWTTLVAAANGTTLIAGSGNGGIYTSTDAGVTWTASNAPVGNWQQLALSTDGTAGLGTQLTTGDNYLYSSANSGASWSAVAPNLEYFAVAVSPDGTHMLGSSYSYLTNMYQLFLSTNAGAAWTALASPAGATDYFISAAWSPTGLVAVGSFNSVAGVFTSTDGTTWTLSEADLSQPGFNQLAASSDGSQIYAVDPGAGIAISTDAGAHWNVEPNLFSQIATSPDGTVAVGGTGGLLGSSGSYGAAGPNSGSSGPPTPATIDAVSISTDSGGTWEQLPSNGLNYAAFAVAPTDQKVWAASTNGPIYALSAASTSGTAGSVTGEQNQSVTLQYEGNGTWLVLSNEGQFGVN